MTNPSRTGVTAGVAPGPRPAARPPGRRARRTTLAGFALGSVGLSLFVAPEVAQAAVPTFPNNIVVFPDRDFVTIEGYQDHIGDTALVEVTRNGQVVGSAQGEVAEGDVAFEINHPGGYCWGAGTGINVTPDIRAGDVVSIRFDGAGEGETTTSSGTATAHATRTGTTVVVRGTVGADVNTAQTEQRIINPDLVDGAVGRRDVRALPGPVVPSDKGGYSSGLEFGAAVNGVRPFTATYVFGQEADAVRAASAGGERLMSWQEEDADANRQGLTIAEFGEAGGPGMGGCPAGPGQVGAPAPGSGTYLLNGAGDQVRVDWAAATAAPDASPVTGYQVSVIGAAGPDGTSSVVGRRTGATATNTTIPLSPAVAPGADLAVEVRAMTQDGSMSKPLTVTKAVTGTGTEPPAGEVGGTTGPAVTASGTDPVTLAVPAGADVYVTTDGSPAFVADMPGDTARRYTGPIDITTADTTIHWVAYSGTAASAGSFGPYQPAAATGLPAPVTVSATPGQAGATVTWSAVTGAAKYVVRATPPAGSTNPAVTVEAGATATQAVLGNLVPGVAYSVTVTPWTSTTAGSASTPVTVTATAVTTDRLTLASARYRANDRLEVSGTGTLVGAVVTLRTGPGPDAPAVMTRPAAGVPSVPVTATVVAPVAPATVGTWDVRLRGTATPVITGTQVWVTSDRGGSAGPITLGR